MEHTAQKLRSFHDEVEAAREFWKSYFDAIPAPFESGSDEPTKGFIQFLKGTHSKYPQATVASHGADVEAFLKSCVHEQDFATIAEWDADGLNGDSLNREEPTFKEYLCGAVFAPSKYFKAGLSQQQLDAVQEAFESRADENAAWLTRTVPESLSIKFSEHRNIENIRILWLLKNPAYGGNDVIRLARDGMEGVANTKDGGRGLYSLH